MSIPKWFLYVMSIVASLFTVTFIPWAGWVTMTLATLSVKIENTEEIRNRIDKLETSHTSHITEPAIHGPLANRVEQLEERMNQLARELKK